MRYDTNLIRFFFRTNTSGVLDPNKCAPLLSSHCRGLKTHSGDTALASHGFGKFPSCRDVHGQVLTHAMKTVTILWSLLGLDRLWYFISSAPACLIRETRLGRTFSLLRNRSPCCRREVWFWSAHPHCVRGPERSSSGSFRGAG